MPVSYGNVPQMSAVLKEKKSKREELFRAAILHQEQRRQNQRRKEEKETVRELRESVVHVPLKRQ